MATASMEFRATGSKVTLRSRTLEVLGYRELLANLVRKELKVRYKNSVLGFLWTLVNPAVTIGVYAVIFGAVFKSNVPAFALFLMTGVLIWNMFSIALGAACGSVVGNAPLVKKVWFPREILPLASIGAALVDFLLQSSVLVVAIAIAAFTVNHWQVQWQWLPLIPLAVITALLLTAALAIWLAAVNVRYRDTQHFLGIALMVWFWGTPIIYSINQVTRRLDTYNAVWLPYLNPMTPIVLAFQRALYGVTPARIPSGRGTTTVPVLPSAQWGFYLGLLGAVAAVSLLLIVGAMRVFRKAEGDFAEEL